MKNIAILLGITDYEKSTMQLPACANDVAVMQTVCQKGQKFHEIITIKSANAESVKNDLANIIQRFSQEDIGDLLFYYTGHGIYIDEDFRYQLRDFDESQVAQTSISNEELDGMLHGLSPNVLIKVIDACYSGINYIKDGTSISDYMAEEIKGAFARCYFFFSSQIDQKSYADNEISDFTAAFAEAVASSKTETVRYKHIVDSISDSFASRRKQVPQFVVQANFTETLGEYSAKAKESISQLFPRKSENGQNDVSETEVEMTNEAPEENQAPAVAPPTLVQLALASAQRYVSMEDAKKIISSIQGELKGSAVDAELGELYALEKEFFGDYPSMPNETALGKWLQENNAGEYFATPVFDTETYEAPRSHYSGLFNIAAHLGYDQQTVTKTRKVLSGITTDLTGMPFLTHSAKFSPRLPNLLQYKGWFTFLISKTTVQVFYCAAEYRETSWGHFSLSFHTNWTRISFELTSPQDIPSMTQRFYLSLFEWVKERTRLRLAAIAKPSE